ncbi:MAG: 3-phosphoshikimate 1-carboxyvinyltransferase, partial [Thermoguttaceae bacterium]|nr:3-phosphoshikimate 1-carboxyvinyltransferase [Thermoguttaceae bacterium]
ADLALAVVALFAETPTRIRGVEHMRRKETDRVAATAAELRKLGASVEEFPDGLAIVPPSPDARRAARIATYDDHRMAMSFALAGLKIDGVEIENPGCVAKTYPNYFADLARATAPTNGGEAN